MSVPRWERTQDDWLPQSQSQPNSTKSGQTPSGPLQCRAAKIPPPVRLKRAWKSAAGPGGQIPSKKGIPLTQSSFPEAGQIPRAQIPLETGQIPLKASQQSNSPLESDQIASKNRNQSSQSWWSNPAKFPSKPVKIPRTLHLRLARHSVALCGSGRGRQCEAFTIAPQSHDPLVSSITPSASSSRRSCTRLGIVSSLVWVLVTQPRCKQ